MQKKLIALAIMSLASSAAFADSAAPTVGMYGVLDGGIANVSGTGMKGALLGISGGLSASRLGVKATEKLDNGMTAIAVLEYGLDGEVNQTVGGGSPAATGAVARQQLLGLAGDFGTVATGYLQTTGYDFADKFDPFVNSSISSLQNVTGSNFLLGANGLAARAPRAVAYISPDINGLSFAVNYSTAVCVQNAAGSCVAGSSLGNAAVASGNADANITATLASVSYALGNLNVEAVYAGLGGVGTATEFGLGASYDLTVAKLLATYQSNSSGGTAALTTRAYSLSGVVPVTTGAVALGYAANSGAAATATAYSLGYLLPMSKTTTAYAAYSAVTNSGNTAGTNGYSVDNGVYGTSLATGASSNVVAVGLSKKF